MNEITAKQKIETLCFVSRETISRLEVYAELLEKWNPKINLVSKSTLGSKWERHFLDSAQVWPLIPKTVKSLVDIGSGAGFAGLVIALIGMEKRPELSVTLIESDARKCAFMRNVSRETGLRIDIQTKRIEDVTNFNADIVTARALATVSQLLKYSENLLVKNGSCLFLKGDACAIELAEAQKSWIFSAKETQSVTHSTGRLLYLTGIKRAN